jgi:hypothetical protein
MGHLLIMNEGKQKLAVQQHLGKTYLVTVVLLRTCVSIEYQYENISRVIIIPFPILVTTTLTCNLLISSFLYLWLCF